MLKKRIASDVSRRLNPKDNVPTIPVIMLNFWSAMGMLDGSSVAAHGKRLVLIVNQTKKTLIDRVSVLSSIGTGVMPRSSTPKAATLDSHECGELISCDSTTAMSATDGL